MAMLWPAPEFSFISRDVGFLAYEGKNRVAANSNIGYDQSMNQQISSDYQKVQAAIAYLSKNGPDTINLEKFSRALGLTERQLVALFSRWCGLTPKSFAQAVALDHAKSLLADNASVLDTSFEVGLSSTSRLHDLFVTYHSMPPGAWAGRGAGMVLRWGIAQSPFGSAIIFASEYGITGLGFVDDTEEEAGEEAAFEDFANRWPAAQFLRDDNFIKPLASGIFQPELWHPDRPVRIVMIGTDFEIKVWETLLKVPLGAAETYGNLAKHLGKPKAARAVGSAVGRNPISFVVPCHRIVGSTGKLTGYHWGVARKRAILGWETGQKSRR